MQYNVAQLLKGPTGGRRRYEIKEDIEYLDRELVPLRPLVGAITLTRTSQGILVQGKLRTVLQTDCRRCLEPCQVAVVIELEEEFHPVVAIAESPIDELLEEGDDDALRIDAHHVLDLSEVIRQQLWLVLPMDALCRPDCAGLCPTCGGNRNLGECQCEAAPVDPRWAALQALITEEQEP